MQNQQDIETNIDLMIRNIKLTQEQSKISLSEIEATLPQRANSAPIENLKSASAQIDTRQREEAVARSLSTFNQQFELLKQQLQEIKKENSHLANRNSSLENALTEAITTVAKYELLEKEIREAEKLLASQQTSEERLKQSLEKNSSVISKLQQQLDEKKKQVNELELFVTETKVLKKEVSLLKRTLGKQEIEIEKQENQLENLTEELATKKEAITEKSTTIKVLEEKVQKLETASIKSQILLEEKNSSISNLKSENSQLKSLTNNLNRAENENQKLRDQLSEIRQKLQRETTENYWYPFYKELISLTSTLLVDKIELPFSNNKVKTHVLSEALFINYQLCLKEIITPKAFKSSISQLTSGELLEVLELNKEYVLIKGKVPFKLADLLELMKSENSYESFIKKVSETGLDKKDPLLSAIFDKIELGNTYQRSSKKYKKIVI